MQAKRTPNGQPKQVRPPDSISILPPCLSKPAAASGGRTACLKPRPTRRPRLTSLVAPLGLCLFRPALKYPELYAGCLFSRTNQIQRLPELRARRLVPPTLVLNCVKLAAAAELKHHHHHKQCLQEGPINWLVLKGSARYSLPLGAPAQLTLSGARPVWLARRLVHR